jgi:glycosyltransferase involved in cell wall biosynthesis
MVAWRWIEEFLSIKLANQLFCLTPGYVQYFSTLYKTRIDKFNVVPDGIQDIWLEEPVSAGHASNPEDNPPTRVLYWGMFLIHHGLEVVINVANKLRDEKVEFIFCGSGEREETLKKQAKEKKLSNVIFKGFIPTMEELIHLVDSADVCLGFFSATHDVSFTIPNKVQQGMARSKPVVTLWNKDIEDLYRTKNNLCPPLILIHPDSKSLAKAIMEVIKDRQRAEQIGNAARLTVQRVHGIEAVTSALKESLERAFKY